MSSAVIMKRRLFAGLMVAAFVDTVVEGNRQSLGSVVSAIRQDDSQNIERTRRRQRDLIVGGTTSPPGRFPYVVSLQMEKVLDEAASAQNDGATVMDEHTCGGTLIAPDVALTAAHCGYEELPSSHINNHQEDGSSLNFGEQPKQIFYGADVGAYDISQNDGGGYTVENMLFEKLVLHPDYTGFHGKGAGQMSLQHDVMLVKLYGASDQPVVRLHDPKLDDYSHMHREPMEGESLVILGWGDTDPATGEEGTKLASVLRAASVTFVPNDVCENSKGYSSIQSSLGTETYFEYTGTISDDMMCARGDLQQDACQGDSGGGLIRLGDDDFSGSEDVQMGIISWGLQCGDADFPGVYSRVGEHFDWIAKNVCELSDSPPEYFNCPTKPYPAGSSNDQLVDITVTIRFDDYRSETGWVLESMPDFRNIVFRQFGAYKPVSSVDENNSMSETVTVFSGRFYMLSILDEFADGFCCTSGEGFFRVDSDSGTEPLVDTTPGILWTPHALRRAFYVSPPDVVNPPNYITIVVTLSMGADPGKLLLVAVENVMVSFDEMALSDIYPNFFLRSCLFPSIHLA